MTDLLDVLRTLDPVPHGATYDDATVDRNVATIVTGVSRPVGRSGPAGHPVGTAVPADPTSPRVRLHRRWGGRPVLAGVVVVAVLALVATSVAVTRGWIRPLAGHPAATPTSDVLFGPDIDPATVRARIVGSGDRPVTLWSASSPALGHCLAVTSATGAWTAAPAPDAGWRPQSSGAACLDDRISEVVVGTGFIARFVDAGAQVFAGGVTVPEKPYEYVPSDGVTATATPDNGPTSGVVTSVEVSTSDGQVHPGQVGDGLFLTAPVPTGGCPTVVARNGAGTVLSSDVVAANCPGAPAVTTVRSGSDAPDIHLNNNLYAGGMSSGLSALTRRDPSLAAGDTDGMTVLTLSVQFFDACQSPPGPDGFPPYPDPCTATRVPIPTDIDLQLTYGADHTPAVADPGRGGPGDDFGSPPTPGYVGGKVFGLLVYRTFLVPDDQLGLLTARWTGDATHAPLVMDGVQRALGH